MNAGNDLKKIPFRTRHTEFLFLGRVADVFSSHEVPFFSPTEIILVTSPRKKTGTRKLHQHELAKNVLRAEG